LHCRRACTISRLRSCEIARCKGVWPLLSAIVGVQQCLHNLDTAVSYCPVQGQAALAILFACSLQVGL
jgi:hypothetical protein